MWSEASIGATDIMSSQGSTVSSEGKVKTFRWLFYICLVQLMAFFIIPTLGMIESGTPVEYLPYILILATLTLGTIFALVLLVVSVCGIVFDKQRRTLYVTTIVLMSAWILWAIISWSYIEYMDYIL